MSYDTPPATPSGSGGRRPTPATTDALGPVTDDYSYTPTSAPNSAPTSPLTSSNGGSAFEPITPPAPVDAGEATAEPKAAKRPSAIREIVETLLLAFLIFVAVRALVLNFRVDGSSMVPNLQDQEMLLVNRNVYFHFDLNGVLDALPLVERDGERIVYPFHPPERGDIIVFEPPTVSTKPYIKRVIGLPGETVEIRDGNVYIDGQLLDEPYIQDGITDCNRANCSPWTVGEGEVFVMGDNRRNSTDSRIFGPISVDSIIGKAWLTYWPAGEFGLVPHFDYPELSER